MKFDQSIKKIREQHQLTQEQLAEQLFVSRQTISSWENGRNLPDLEMVVRISQAFSISLDTLILGSDEMMNKLIKDGSDIRRKRLNIVNVVLLLIGVGCFIAMALIGSTVDSNGILHEPFFLVIFGYFFIFLSLLFLLGRGIVFFIKKIRNK